MEHRTTAKIFSLVVCTALLLAGCKTKQPEPEGDAEPPPATENTPIAIELGESIAIGGEGATQSGKDLVIIRPGTYRLIGSFEGSVVVEAGEVFLILAGVTINNPDGPAIVFKNNASESTGCITLEEGSKNYLADGGENEAYNAAVYTTGSLVIEGPGSLDIKANNQNGIAAKKNLSIYDGEITVRSEADGISATNDGTASITFGGGNIYIVAGGDAVHSGGTVDVTGGTVIALGAATSAKHGINADGIVTMAGGTLIAAGAGNAAAVFEGEQRGLNADFGDEMVAAGTLVHIMNSGVRVLAFRAETDFNNLLYVGGELSAGTEYEVYTGGETNGEQVNGLYLQSASVKGGELAMQLTTESTDDLWGPAGKPEASPAPLPETIQPR